jgi:two-component system, chemotaxis family, protein-glutamate methylesterase/glutaminase
MRDGAAAPAGKISVLVAEDSRTQREMLVYLLEEAGFEISGTAVDGLEAVEKTERLRPDIVLMDCHMPRADGFEATRMIMSRCPTPIVMCSSMASQDEMSHTFDAIKSGALAFQVKPALDGAEVDGSALIQTLRLMSDVKVVGRRALPLNGRKRISASQVDVRHVDLICIAGSTGAPGVIADILTEIGRTATAPILIVQHMAAGFVGGFAKWLSTAAGIPVRVAEDGVKLVAGEAYLAPDDRHMGINGRGHIALSDAPPEEGFRPSADHLFHSAAQFNPAGTIAVLLTGMGRDGAAGLTALHRAGALTMVQDEATCVVFGMPREAIARGGVTHVLPPSGIAQMICASNQRIGG